MCKIKQIVERDLADSYLGEAVMEDAEREKVNKYGFCEKHFDLLYLGRSKLGLALQISTRLDKLIKSTKPINKAKDSKNAVLKLKENSCSCIICNKMEFHLKRYFETVPKLYRDDARFREQSFPTIKGFCYPHFIRLVENSKHAGKYSEEFLKIVYQKEIETLTTLKKDVDDFTSAFDYRSKGLPTESSKVALKSTRVKLYGELPLPPERK